MYMLYATVIVSSYLLVNSFVLYLNCDLHSSVVKTLDSKKKNEKYLPIMTEKSPCGISFITYYCLD